MPFRFRLEKVMKVRQRAMEQQSLRVAAAAQALHRIEEARDQLDAEIFRFLRTEAVQRGTLQVQDLLSRTHWHNHLNARREDLTARMAGAAAQIQSERAELTRLWRDLEVLKQLEKTQKSAWMAEVAARENRDLDEIGQIRADRMRRAKVTPSTEHPA